MYEWIQLPEEEAQQMGEGGMKELTLANKQVVILKRKGELLAFAATCPHAGAHLCEGWLDAQGRVVCPLHGYRFDPKNGRNTSGEGYKLRTYPVEMRDGLVFIGFII